MKYWLLAVALALLPSVASAQTVKVGFVDIQRVIADSAAGKRAKERFQAQIKKAEADIQKERIDLDRLKADIEKKGPLLKDEERRNMEADFQKRSVSLQRTMGDYQTDLQQKEREMMGDILKDLEQIVTDVGKAEKFTIIFEKSQIIYSDPSTDITSRVIETYNNRAKK